MDSIKFFITFTFTFLISSQIVLLFLARIFNRNEKAPFISLFFLSLGLGPLLIAICLEILIFIIPYQSQSFYILSVCSLFIIFFIIGHKKLGAVLETYRVIVKKCFQAHIFKDYLKIVILIFVTAIYLLIYLQAVALPILGSDEIKFVFNAKNQVEKKIDRIQLKDNKIDRKQAIKDFLRGSSYPSVGLYSWFFVINSPEKADLLCRILAPTYYFFLLGLLGYILWPRGEWTVVWGLILLVSIPLLIQKTIGNSQDPGNLFVLFLTLTWLGYAFEQKKAVYFIIWIFILVVSLLSGRISYLLIPFSAISALVLILNKHPKRNIIFVASFVTIFLLFVIGDLYRITGEKENEIIQEENNYLLANNYYANRDIINQTLVSSNKGLCGLISEKYLLLKKVFSRDHYNILPFIVIFGILYWALFIKLKKPIGVIFLTSIIIYSFMVLFHNNQIFFLSNTYSSKIAANQYFLVYSRYLLVIIIIMVFFNAVFLGRIYDKIKNMPAKIALTASILFLLLLPLKNVLLNKKQSLGVDDWKKIFFCSDYEKLISYRGGYGEIIEYLNNNVGEKEFILTPTRFKFIPYYSKKYCINVDNFDKLKVFDKNPEKIYKLLRRKGIKYILPAEKGLDYSYIEQSLIQKIITDIGMSFISFDNAHWRVYKLRDEIKETVRFPVYIPNGNFEHLKDNHPENWNVYAERPGLVLDKNKITWGIIDETENSHNRTIFLENNNVMSNYLYSGAGDFQKAPSNFKDYNYTLKASTNYKIKWSAKGSRPVSMNFWFIEYDQSGHSKWHLKKQMLTKDFNEMIASFKAGTNAKEFRVAFHIFDIAILYVKNLSIKIEEIKEENKSEVKLLY